MQLAVVDPSGLFRVGLANLLRTLGFDGVAEAATVDALKRQANGAVPEIVLMRLASEGASTVSVVQEFSVSLPAAKIVLLGARLDMELLCDCFSAGASGFLLENISACALQESLKLVGAGAKVFPSELASVIPELARKIGLPANGGTPLPGGPCLSHREIDILRCLAAGQSNKVIAHNLKIAEATVKVHVKRILRKLKAQNRTHAALWAVARGLATAPDGAVECVQ